MKRKKLQERIKEKKALFFPFVLVLILITMISLSTGKLKQIELLYNFMNNVSSANSSKVVDPSTANNYRNVLGQIDDGGRYAGRVWTDKSVFDNGLTNIDGIQGADISLNDGEEFLLSFSALGSSRILKGQSNSPIDLVLVIDTSSSMGDAGSYDPNGNSDISKTIVATNNLLDKFMMLNENNRVSIILFDSQARILAPLEHYNKNGNMDFITANGPNYSRTIILNYLDESGKAKTLSSTTETGTNLQHGLTLGYEQLLNVASNDLKVIENGNTYNRVPALIVLSDGESNRAYNGEDWWHPSENNYHGGGNTGFGNNSSTVEAGVIRSMKPLMTASYLNNAVEEHYNQNPNVYTIGVGLKEIRAKIALDPETYVVSDSSHLNGLSEKDRNIISQVYNKWTEYKNNGSTTITNLSVSGNNSIVGEYTFKTPTTGTNITTLNYVNKYYDISNAGDLDDIFTTIVSEISSLAFHPITEVTGTSNELDLTYTDPIGEYMDVKEVKGLTLFGKMYIPTRNDQKTENGIKTTTYYFAETDIRHPSYVNEVKVNLGNIKVEVIEDVNGMVTMKIGIPEGALPLRLETVTLTDNITGQQVVESYETNSNSTDALPLRIFYSVGVKDSIKIDTNGDNIPDTVDLNKVSNEYKEKNTNADGTVNFYSNLYTEEDTGNATVNFGPSLLNRYYYFQKNRIIYSNPNGSEGVISNGTNNPGAGYTPVTNIDDLKDDQNYYLVIDYYRPKSITGIISGEGEYVNYIVERNGAELKNSVTYYNTKTFEISDTPANDYVVATKVGGVRLGRLNRFTETKHENSTRTATYAYAPSYVDEENNDDQYFHIALGNNGKLKIGGGNLTISKTVAGSRGNQETDFTFKINLTDTDNNIITGTYDYAGSKTGTINFTDNGATITLKHNESITIYNLPNQAKYTITEIEANQNGYITTSENEEGIIPENAEIAAKFTNTKNTGDLTISKTVAGNGGNTNKEFHFIVTFEDDNHIYNYDGSKTGTIKSGDTITLKHNESITIKDIQANTNYNINETEANKDGYITTSTGESGTILNNDIVNANFTNTREVGNLTISKTVTGNSGETNKDFHFIITFENDNNTYNYNGSKEGTLKSGDTITLKHNESITIHNILADINYTITELEANQDGYTTTSTGNTGTILKDDTVIANFINTKEVGNLTISKTVVGNGGDINRDFHFIITFENDNNTYNYDGSKTGTIKSGDTITLKHNENITIHNVLAGTNYTVTELEANQDGYTTTSTGNVGSISKDNTSNATFTNEKNVGNLTITKTVTGNSDNLNLDKEFHFIVTFENDNSTYNYDGSKTGTIKSGDTITLKHNESITIHNILAGTNYMVTETEANTDSYITTSTGETGTITENNNITAAFINEKNVGSLTITKTVTGNVEDLNIDWNFNINLKDQFNNPINGTFNYTGSKEGTATFTDNGANITLKHGESITINNLPTNAKYTITELEANQNGYTTTSTGNTGTITTESINAEFINNKELGTLIISKKVIGNGGDTNKDFHFTLTLTDKDNNQLTNLYEFTGSKEGTIKSGDTITLKNEESIIIHGIEANTNYQVVEEEANTEGYTTTMTNDTGEILAETNKEAAFINKKEIPLGDIKISKTVTGIGDPTVSWIFKITFTDEFNNPINEIFNYDGSKTGTIKNGDTIALKHNEYITIHGIKEGTNYFVEELGANTEGYTTTMENETGQIIGNNTITTNFINHIEPPILTNLTISKIVTGNGGDINRDFHFTVIFDNNITYSYDGSKTGTIKNGDTITLKHGESITIHGIEEGTIYSIIELEANQDGYITTSENNNGTMNQTEINAQFINNRNVGDLTISKIVTGNDGEIDKDFHFTITFENNNNIYSYDGSKEGTIKNGDTITLKHGESITIHDIEEGTLYNVIELEANKDGYTTTSENDNGMIIQNENITITYTNNKTIEIINNPDTSDTNITLYFILMIISIIGLFKGLYLIKQN